MGAKKSSEKKETALSFEAALQRLEEITAALSDGNVGLDAALALYAEGVQLVGECQKRLSDAKQTVETLGTAGQGDENNAV